MGRLLGLFWERFSCSWEEVVSGLPLDVTPGTASATLHETSLQMSEQRDSRNLGSRWPGGPAKSTSPEIPPTSGLPVERGLTFPASLSHFSPGFLLLGPMPWWTGAPFGLCEPLLPEWARSKAQGLPDLLSKDGGKSQVQHTIFCLLSCRGTTTCPRHKGLSDPIAKAAAISLDSEALGSGESLGSVLLHCAAPGKSLNLSEP